MKKKPNRRGLSRTPSARWSLHPEGYLQHPETSFLLFHNTYPEGMQGGVEIIHHDERLATNGFLRFVLGPEKDAGYAKLAERSVDAGGLKAVVRILEPEIEYTVRLKPENGGVRLTVEIDRPLSSVAAVAAWFSLELFPVPFWGTAWSMDSATGVFPREILDPVRTTADSRRDIRSMAAGRTFTAVPDDPLKRFTVTSALSGLGLYDNRIHYEGGWFALRSDVGLDRSGVVVDWLITPSSIPGWRRPPMLAVSQVGYHPAQPKVCLIELDPRWTGNASAILMRLDPVRGYVEEFSAKPSDRGPWLRYRYAAFDFSSVKKEGTYRIDYAGVTAGPFRISKDVYSRGVWQPTLLEYFPVQMCHMEVWNGGRLWHAACHMDDAMQVPSPLEYIDGYRQAAEPDTGFREFEHIPHLDRGGWHDAGDTDLAAGSQVSTTHVLALCREEFGVDVDETTVLTGKRLVEMRRPDGVPDIVQQIQHGVECILGGYRASGHSFCGIIESIPRRYYQRGEVSAMTDNRVYDPSLREDQVDGNRAGLRDDRYAFTNRDSALEYACAAALALSSTTLRGFDDRLAEECLETAVKAWAAESAKDPVRRQTTYVPRDLVESRVKAAVELFRATADRRYLDVLVSMRPEIMKSLDRCAWILGRVAGELKDPVFGRELADGVAVLAKEQKKEFSSNPFGIAWKPFVWGVGWQIQDLAVRQYYLCKAWPDLFDRNFIYRTVHWVLGCHPGNNVSFVSGVGTRSLTEAFGINRADWSYIAGGNASGVALIRPDFPELKLNFPWLWQQSEYVMSGAATWIFCVLAAERLASGSKGT